MQIMQFWQGESITLAPEENKTLCLQFGNDSQTWGPLTPSTWLTRDQARKLAAALLRWAETGEVG